MQRERSAPRLQDMKILAGYRNEKAKFKTYFVVPKKGVCTVPTALLESEIWSDLRIYELRFIRALLIVHARAGGTKNGRLILTYERLKKWGIRSDHIKRTINKLEELGLLEVTHNGGPGDPSLYRVTFLPHIERLNGRISYFPPGNEWIEIEMQITEGSRNARSKRQPPGRKIGSQGA
jgi:hypothetical protein